MRLRKPLAVTATCVTVLSGLALTACTDSPPAGSIIVVDGTLRAIGADCAGASSFLAFHAGAKLTVTESSGDTVSVTVLSPGTAIAADTRDYGEAKRQPSYCSFAFDTASLTAGEKYQYSLDGDPLGEFTYRLNEGKPAPIAYPALGDPASALKGSSQ